MRSVVSSQNTRGHISNNICNEWVSNRLFGRTSYRLPQKRPASCAFELEITDDEDEELTGGRYPFNNFPVSKRPRAADYVPEIEMSSRKDLYGFIYYEAASSSQYATRGSGRTPVVEGLDKQPWEFNFDHSSSKRKVDKKVNAGEVAGFSGGLKHYLKASHRAQANSNSSGAKVVHIPIVRTEDKSRKANQKEPDIITLDDDDSSDYSSALVPVAPSRKEMALIRPKISSSMKVYKRDRNRFFKCDDTVAKRFNGTMSPNNSIRPLEKDTYQELLRRLNVMNTSGTYSGNLPLFRTKVGKPDLQGLYNGEFQTIPTTTTTLIARTRALIKSTSGSRDDSLPRLFSTPNVLPSSKSRAASIASPKDAPLVIDLEPDKNCRDLVTLQPPISPISRNGGTLLASPSNVSAVGNYSNLEDALNNSALVLDAKEDVEKSGSAFAVEESQLSIPDEDISIISEKIINRSRDISINTLALEQTSCPYVDKRWLVESQSTWRENEKYRQQRLAEEAGTMQLLQQKSTLCKDLDERLRSKLTLTEIIVLEEPPAELPELDDEMVGIIQRAKARGNDNEVLAQVRLLKDTISITRGDIKTLGPSQWLNDNVINTYMGLIVLRSKSETTKFLKAYAFQTFFYPKLLKEGYSNSLKRWSRKDDIFAHDLIILPIHLGLHWCPASIDFRSKFIRYFDSLGGDNNKCLHSLLDYISKEMQERKKMDLNKSEWSLQNVKGIPQQQNGSDCGMFACKFSEYISRDADFNLITQENMPYYRDRMIYELLQQNLMFP